jgi:hypothetical protein
MRLASGVTSTYYRFKSQRKGCKVLKIDGVFTNIMLNVLAELLLASYPFHLLSDSFSCRDRNTGCLDDDQDETPDEGEESE